ncbi:hypothetical protein K3725_07410 [Leisingera sp. S132]|uniref:hypothetical protein n=1 Tax=Leisingera sp. S132 TaxID=2867016 RepID=UPI0021A5DF69|nr:hypothetical protein [Leisingera sp. S132]UWQ80814.1 hypothetical protein K3725_07410 [Leisingera sp. S132]
MRIKAAAAGVMLAGSALANEPLAAIDWLNQPAPRVGLPGTVLLEPPVAGTAALPQISVTPLETLLPPVGLVPAAATGLPADLWRGSSADDITHLIETVPVRGSPAMQALLFTLLLSETRPPAATGDRILLARLDRLLALGATDPSQALVEHAGPADSKERFARWFDATLLTGSEDASCAALTASPHLSDSYAVRIFCAARRSDWPTAALMLETAHALELLPREQMDLLDRFLNPDLFELAPPLRRPAHPDPLTFRLFETIGESMPTAPLPPAFAAADLRDIAGWKAQLEAAERLARAGALNPNQYLGLFSARKPAASGGIWDRVSAVQKLEDDLGSGSPDTIARSLPRAWQAMQEAGTETVFADLFAEPLARAELTGPAAQLAWRIRLLSPAYETAAHDAQASGAAGHFLAALAQGRPGDAAAPSPLAEAISLGFAAEAAAPPAIRRLLDNGQLGEAILRSMVLFAQGADGNLGDLTAALAAFRAVGLEDTARRAALQLMLLEHG